MSNIQSKETIKGLTSQLQKLTGEIESLKSNVKQIQRELNSKVVMATNLENRINELSKPEEPTVSEHALLRYFERIDGIKINKIEQKILCPEILKMVSVLGGTGKYPHPEGYCVVMKNNMVVTIHSKEPEY